MKPKGLLVAVVLLAGLGGIVWWSNKKQATASATTTTDSATKLLSIPDDQFQSIVIRKAGADAEDLERENGKWKLTGPKPLAADQDAVSGVVTNLSALNADKVVEDKAADLKPYGLDNPSLDIQIKQKNGKTAELLVGDDTPTGSGAYAKLAGDGRVVTVASFVKTSLDKKPDDLRDKRLVLFDQDKITRVDLQAKGVPVEFGKDAQGEWQILKPRPLRADASSVNGLVDKLRDAKMDLSGAGDTARQFAASARVATATVADAGGNHTIEIRKDKDKNYYAKSSDVAGEYKIASDVGDGLDKSLDDFRNKKLFDFGFSDPGKVEVPGTVYDKSGDKWMAGGKSMDNSAVQNLIDKLRDLSAAKFAGTAGGEAVFTATVTSNSGKRVEKVTIRKQGAEYFAQRENEPGIYQVDGKSVEDLQAAAKNVKPAAPETPKKK
jgi:Domain of unknown function (DUF4340)